MRTSATETPLPPGAGLRRMRTVATGLLVAMAVVFVGASVAAHGRPEAAHALGYVRAFAEAAMVGACADWFAVTALFRRPFGLPIPHTGIVPRNKDRIGAALGAFIADEFLTAQVLDERLRRLEVARWGGEWIGQAGHAERLAQQVAALAPDLLDALPPRALRTLIGSVALAAASAVPAADLASRALGFAWSDGRAQAVIERGAEMLRAYLETNQEVILTKVHEQSGKWMPAWIDRIIARKITSGVIQLLADLCDPAHPWRVGIDLRVHDWVERLAHDPDLRARAEQVKARLLEDERLRGGLDALWTALEGRLDAEVRDRDALARRLADLMLAGGAWLRRNAAVQDILNEWARGTLRGVVAPRRHEIGRFVAQVVSGWDVESVVEKLEHQVGRDLQYIRINGTLVGGLVGLVIYAAARALDLS